MSNPKNSSDFSYLLSQRGPNVAAESQIPDAYRSLGQAQAGEAGQAQHGVDLGSGCKTAGQADGGTFGLADLARNASLADAILRLQERRNREIAERELGLKSQAKVADAMRRETVAKQQAALLDEVSADAVAPMAERKLASERPGQTLAGLPPIAGRSAVFRREQYDAARFEALERQVQWLMERGQTHARQIAALQGDLGALGRQVIELRRRVQDLEHVIAEAFPARPVGYRASNGLDTCLSVGPSVVAPNQYGLQPPQTPGHEGCEHDMLKPNTTVSAITRKKARCNICAQVWESA